MQRDLGDRGSVETYPAEPFYEHGALDNGRAPAPVGLGDEKAKVSKFGEAFAVFLGKLLGLVPIRRFRGEFLEGQGPDLMAKRLQFWTQLKRNLRTTVKLNRHFRPSARISGPSVGPLDCHERLASILSSGTLAI